MLTLSPPPPQLFPLPVFPMFQTLAGVKELAAKAKEDYTLEDVRTRSLFLLPPFLLLLLLLLAPLPNHWSTEEQSSPTNPPNLSRACQY